MAYRICEGQNLVLNGDFEEYINCPHAFNDFDGYVSNWTSPTSGTPDFFNQCTTFSGVGVPNNNWGFQRAHSGIGYAGEIMWYGGDYREYIEVPLSSALTTNSCYHYEMYVSLAEKSQFTTSDISIYFSSFSITGANNLFAFTPQINSMAGFITDTLNWTLISGSYVATGGEQYLIIGNFKNNANSMTQLNTFGFLQEAYVYIDDVSLTLCTDLKEQNKNTELDIYPNPMKNQLNTSVNNNEPSEIILYDITSRIFLQQKFRNSVSLNTQQLAKGIYIYEIRNKNGVIKKGKVAKD
ncbi:MAG: T9SS type A sorting domain-containing protein [Ginsengibacter sp.]